jgi:hypothetical protein
VVVEYEQHVVVVVVDEAAVVVVEEEDVHRVVVGLAYLEVGDWSDLGMMGVQSDLRNRNGLGRRSFLALVLG